MIQTNINEANEEIKIKGTVEIITLFKEENGYAILKVHPTFGYDGNEDLVTVCCTTPSVQRGEELEITGKYVFHPKYGFQIKATNVETLMPDSPFGIYSLLCGGFLPGVGKVSAKKLVDAFGVSLFDVIENEPNKLRKIKGLTDAKIEKIKKAYDEKKGIKNILTFCSSHGITNNMALKIYEIHKGNSIKVIKESPYTLTNIKGFGFAKVDDLAKKFGIANDDPNRIKYGALYILKDKINAGMGHCGYPKDLFIEEMVKTLSVDYDLCKSILNSMITEEKDSRIIESDIDNIPCVFNEKLANTERLIANYLFDIRDAKTKRASALDDVNSLINKAEKRTNIQLAMSQKEAIIRTLKSKVSIITGGPGVGKTTIINILITIYESTFNTVRLAAPTGRASKRMKEATGHEATTIHRLLEIDREHGGFKHNENEPLEGSVFIFDETSMIDTSLMGSLVRAIPKNAVVIFVGDVDQLPSVGAGQVLADLINSNAFTVSRLTEIFRQAKTSKIITNAHNVNNGLMPDLSNNINADFFFINSDEPDSCANLISKMIKNNIPNRWGFNPIKDVQVLCPMKSSGIGTEALNKKLQYELNPNMYVATVKESIKSKPYNSLSNEELTFLQQHPETPPVYKGKIRAFTINDKVMQIKNNYDKNIFNGDVGFVYSIEIKEQVLCVSYPEENGDRIVEYNFKELDEIILAYACTVHKSQGSEYPVVIIPLMNQHYMMLQRKLLYTGITRGKKIVILIGQKDAVHRAVVGKTNEFKRFTKLKIWLQILNSGKKVSFKIKTA